MTDNRYSVTSNEVKLFKHLSNLQSLQNGKARPIMVHVSPTNKCNRKCVHCCFDNRDKSLEMPIRQFEKMVDDFAVLGVKALEFTGGGEPTMYTFINTAIAYAKASGMSLGINTNGLSVDQVGSDMWKRFSWVRIASNIFDSYTEETLKRFTNAATYLQAITELTSCYIMPHSIGPQNIHKVVAFANQYKIVTRVAPDCMQTREGIKADTDIIIAELAKYPDNKFCFCSDFNVYLFDREDNVCLLHTIKPFVYTDGWVYCCPSSELAIENGATMNPKLRVCRVENIIEYYNSPVQTYHHTCSYCKYAQQNKLLAAIIQETNHNEFA